jgi:hypothetical protein
MRQVMIHSFLVSVLLLSCSDDTVDDLGLLPPPDVSMAPRDLSGPDLTVYVDLFGADFKTPPPPTCTCLQGGQPNSVTTGFACANGWATAGPIGAHQCAVPFDLTSGTQVWKCTQPNVWELAQDCTTLGGTPMTCKSCPAGCPDTCQLKNANDTSCHDNAPTNSSCNGS